MQSFPKETFRNGEQVAYCQSCEKAISIDQCGQVIQYMNTNKHKENRDRKLKFKRNFVTTSTRSTNNQSVSNDDLCHLLYV